jgi:hypothetical protein
MVNRAAEAFVTDPGAWADPGRAAGLIAPGLRSDTAQRLLTSPRLAARASRLLAEHLGCGDPATLEPGDLALASAAVAVLETVALGAGAVWHTRRVRALVLGADIALLSSRCGEAVRTAALGHAALAPGEDRLVDADRTAADDANALADDIERDGGRCFSAWIDTLPGWAASRVRLKWRGGLELPASEDERACAARIVRALAAEALAA